MKNLGNILLVIFSLIVTIIIVEGFLRLIDKPKFSPILTGWKCTTCDVVNELGYRGQPIDYVENDFIILLLGDSQIETGYCSIENTPAAILQKELKNISDKNIRIFTIGAAGYGNDQQLLALKEYFKTYRADLVLLWQTAGNDVWNNVWPTHWPENGTFKPTFKLTGDSLIWPEQTIGDTLNKNYKSKIKLLLNRVRFNFQNPDGEWEKNLPPAYQLLSSKEVEEITGKSLKNIIIKDLPLDENVENEKTHLNLSLYPKSDRLNYGIRLTHNLLSKIKNVANSNNADFYILDIKPKSVSEFKVYKVKNKDKYVISSAKTFEESVKEINKNLKSLKYEITWENWKVSATDSHINCASLKKIIKDISPKIAADNLRR